MTGRAWRTEADEEFLRNHRGDMVGRIRRLARLGAMSSLGGAISESAIGGGVLGGAPRNPKLRPDGSESSYVRQAERQYAYTHTLVVVRWCRVCGHRKLERHVVERFTEDHRRRLLGSVTMCAACQAGSWMFETHSPRAVAARARGAKVVL